MSGNPRGRVALPSWFRERSPEALRYLLDVATGVEPAETQAIRTKACEYVVDRAFGKAPKAPEDAEQDAATNDRLATVLAALASTVKRAPDDPG